MGQSRSRVARGHGLLLMYGWLITGAGGPLAVSGKAWPVPTGIWSLEDAHGGWQGLETQGKQSGPPLPLCPPEVAHRIFWDAGARRLATRLLRNMYAEVCAHSSKLQPRQQPAPIWAREVAMWVHTD